MQETPRKPESRNHEVVENSSYMSQNKMSISDVSNTNNAQKQPVKSVI